MKLSSLIKQVKKMPNVFFGKDFACYQKSLIIQSYLSQYNIQSEIMIGRIKWEDTNISRKLKRMIGNKKTGHVFLSTENGIIEPVFGGKLKYFGNITDVKKLTRFNGWLSRITDHNDDFYQALNKYSWEKEQ